jgi:spore coat polysaccharide biosynthesis predicted glycosyltransferase SpsG
MRCLTLAEQLRVRGHETHLMSSTTTIDWLVDEIRKSGIVVHSCELDSLPAVAIKSIQPDWLVVDSYRIDANSISLLASEVPTLAIFDGDDRGINATLYLEQNLGSESAIRPAGREDRYLAGAQYALVREAVLDAERAKPWVIHQPPRVLCFMGGTDPTQSVVGAVSAINALDQDIELTAIAPVHLHKLVEASVTNSRIKLRLLAPTPELPSLLGQTDVVVSAAGTSTWDICTLGIPAVLVAVVENQRDPLREVIDRGLAIGLDVVGADSNALMKISESIGRLLDHPDLRERLSRESRLVFDGGGARRVAERLEHR